MTAAPTNAGIAASHGEFKKSASKVAQSTMKILSPVRAAGQSAARAQQKTVARRSHRVGIIVAMPATTNALAAASTIQPYQNMGGPTPVGCLPKSRLPSTG